MWHPEWSVDAVSELTAMAADSLEDRNGEFGGNRVHADQAPFDDSLCENRVHESAVDVGEAEVTALEAEGQA